MEYCIFKLLLISLIPYLFFLFTIGDIEERAIRMKFHEGGDQHWLRPDMDPNPTVETPLGKVKGHLMKSRGGRQFMAFSGLPYAKPPVGDLMFKPPEPIEPWDGIYNATKDGPLCAQYTFYFPNSQATGVLDCLYLSLYTHDVKRKAPVMIMFHGGGFVSGNGPRSIGPTFLMDEDVVLVLVNYRLGIYGFLSFEDDEMPGNQGMKDQVMALRWIQKNIASYGGDPDNVTVTGFSAGSVCASLHIVSPLSQDLFHKVVTQSGTAYSNWGLPPPGKLRENCIKFLSVMGHTYETTDKAVEFLKCQDPMAVCRKYEELRVWQTDPMYLFGPVLESKRPGAFLPGPISQWEIKPVPLLTGVCSAEGLFRSEYFLKDRIDFKWYNNNFNRLAPLSLMYAYSASNPDEVSQKVKEYYFQNKDITGKDWPTIFRMYNSLTLISNIEQSNKHSGDVYAYVFDYLGEWSFTGHRSARNPKHILGAIHADEMLYLYNQVMTPKMSILKGEDLKVSKKLVKLWTNFAKYGNPTPEGSDVHWDKWSPEKFNWLHISAQGFEMKEGYSKEDYAFWKSINFRDKFD